MSSSQPRIFLIGFNKCGTTSFHDYFTAFSAVAMQRQGKSVRPPMH